MREQVASTMRGVSVNPPYTLLAKYYDRFFHEYRPIAQSVRRRLLDKILARAGAACDLACGTGSTALELARAGLKVFAVDLSPGMCDRARRKARQERLPVTVIQADMRCFHLPEPVDLVTCEYDAINHVPHKRDLLDVARAVARALSPGGHFFFDANNRLSLEKAWPVTWCIERSGVLVLFRGGYDRGRAKAFSDVDLFVRKGNEWERFRERVEEVCWTKTEIRRVLRQVGFDQVREWDAAPFWKQNPYVHPGYRSYYLARKAPLRAG